MKVKEVKKDCFAYFEKYKEPMCHALVEIDCEKCSFYKTIDKIKDNPFYPDSYSDKGKLNYDMKKRKIKKEDQLSWK